MLHLDKEHLDRRCTEIAKDVSNKKLTSSSWIWVGMGAIAGLVLSCLRIKNGETKPIFASFEKGKTRNGFVNRIRNRKNNKGL